MSAKFYKTAIAAVLLALVMSISAPTLTGHAATSSTPGIVLAEDCGTTAS